LSSRVIAVGIPPPELTRINGPWPLLNTIISLRAQAAPSPNPSTSQMVCTGPPLSAIFINFPLAKKPINWPSGDQKGNLAPSVELRGSL
jgi:hypothetical protein